MRTNTSAKLPYQKPRLRVIDLAAEEVLVVGCKTVSKAAPLNPAACNTNNCSSLGS